MCNDKNLNLYYNIIEEQDLNIYKVLIWVKDNKIMGQFYMGQKEYIIFARKGNAKKINDCGTSDVLIFPNNKLKHFDVGILHDTPKPIELMEVLIKNSTKENDIVLDFMSGIGSTLIAADRLNRKCIGIEIKKKYCDITIERLNRIQTKLDI